MKFRLVNAPLRITLMVLLLSVCYTNSATAGLKNVVTVAKENGDFVSLQAAMNSITDASATNRYVVKLAPGFHNLRSILFIKPYVSLVGEDRRNTIVRRLPSLDGEGSGTAVIQLSDNTSVRKLTIRNVGGQLSSVGVVVRSDKRKSILIDEVDIHVFGGLRVNRGLDCMSSHFQITNSNIVVKGGKSTLKNHGFFGEQCGNPYFIGGV